MTIQQQIKFTRERRGLSRADIAGMTLLTVEQIEAVEEGSPPLYDVELTAAALGLCVTLGQSVGRGLVISLP